MSITVEWDDDDRTVIRCTLSEWWTWRELDVAWDQIETLKQTVNHPAVDVIVIVQPGMLAPADMMSRLRTDYLNRALSKPSIDVVVGANIFLRLFWETVTKIVQTSPLEVYFVESLDEARQFIRDFRNSPPAHTHDSPASNG